MKATILMVWSAFHTNSLGAFEIRGITFVWVSLVLVAAARFVWRQTKKN